MNCENMQLYATENSILQKIEHPVLQEHHVNLYVKRDDLIDADVSGNKWRKLKFNIEQLIAIKKEGIITFGGAFSNHLVATAAACQKANVKAIGIVRGEELNAQSNETLKRCEELGMELIFVSREEYALRNDRMYWEDLCREHSNYMVIPEGGANFYGMLGCQELVGEISIDYDAVFVAQGTTATSCGILLGLKESAQLHVVPVLKNFDSHQEMANLLNYSIFDEDLTHELLQRVHVHSDAHCGGYGKYTPELLQFIQQFYQATQLKLDPIYTGKVMMQLWKLIESGEFINQTVVFIHTGGIQGAKGVEEKEKITLYA